MADSITRTVHSVEEQYVEGSWVDDKLVITETFKQVSVPWCETHNAQMHPTLDQPKCVNAHIFDKYGEYWFDIETTNDLSCILLDPDAPDAVWRGTR